MSPRVSSAVAEDETQRRPPPGGCRSAASAYGRARRGVQPPTTQRQRAGYSEAVLAPRLSATLLPRPIRTMVCERARTKVWGPIVAGLLCGIGLPASPQTASKLPPTPPTSTSNPTPPISTSNPVPPSPAIMAPATPPETAQRYRARVTYSNGLLEVHADNSSLNQILREISRQTGMKIVGGVADQRVFGSYGPAPAPTVLQTLLDGTGTNVLLQESGAHEPEQLVLSPRTGASTSPPPSSPIYNATDTEPELPVPSATQPATQAQTAAPPTVAPTTATTPPNALATPSTPPNTPTVSAAPVTNSAPTNSLSTPPAAQPVNPAPPATATTTQSSPNGVKTPEQIYEELKQLQQKKADPQANAQGSPAPK